MKKKETDMMTTKSKNRLSVFNSGVFDDDGKELVISCGYTNGGKFGYFICKETRTGKSLSETDVVNYVYEYTDQTAFYLKENEKTYQRVLEDVKRAIEDGRV